jgi:hypothetical protein
VTGVLVSRNGEQERYEGDVVVLSAGAANTAKVRIFFRGTPFEPPRAVIRVRMLAVIDGSAAERILLASKNSAY